MARARAAQSGLARWRCARLDPGASLVLLDGRRVTRVLGGTFVDINTIPLAAVESIEILKSGASAVYGADAVAGVVNIHLWKDFRGAQLSRIMATPWTKTPGSSRPTSSLVLVTTRCPLPVTSFIITITPRLTGTVPTPAVPPFLSSNSSPWNFNVSTGGSCSGRCAGSRRHQTLQQFVTPPNSTNGLAPTNTYISGTGRVRALGPPAWL